jgi:hypothetical protein
MDVENLAKELILKNMTPEQQMAVLDSVRSSVAQAKEVQKRKIGENVDLVVQALKKIESDITTRFESVGNSIEKRVLSIKDGRDGSNGKDGRDGKDGKSGRDGLKGDRGVDGQAGRDGVDGVDGISVVNANIDFDGSLVISLSDGREINVGEVVSADVAEKIKVISTMSTNAAVGIKDEGTSISTGVKNINFVGATVTATNSGDDVTVNVSAGTGTVTSVAATGGTGISVTGSPITTTGTLTITNTAPDQTVVLTASTGISTSGTYPSFTITNSAPDQTVVLTAGTGINTSGTYPSFTVTNSAPDQTVALTAGTGISTSGTYPNFTVTNSAPDQTVALTQAGTTTITGTYPNFTISSADQFSGTVTSVAASVPAFLSVTGSPVTTSGTLAIGLSGTALPVANGGTGVTTSTGTTNVVLSNSPTLVTPALGTPSALVGTNITGTATSFNINGTVGATTANTGAFTTLSATGVTTVQAGTAALPAITTSGDTNTGIFFPAADTIAFSEGGTEAMRITSAGDVTIKSDQISSATSHVASQHAMVLRSATTNQRSVVAVAPNGSGGLADFCVSSTSDLQTNYNQIRIGTDGTGFFVNSEKGGTETLKSLRFGVAGTSLTIDTSNNVQVGTTTSNAKTTIITSTTSQKSLYVSQTAATSNEATAAARFTKSSATTTTGQVFIEFTVNNDGAGSGQINANGASAAAFGSFSDRRLKENITDLPSQLANIMALRTVEFDYIESEGGGHQIGFIAQEVQEIYPDLVGERADGMLTLTDLNKNDARLIKAIQEQQALITAMTARITALESK